MALAGTPQMQDPQRAVAVWTLLVLGFAVLITLVGVGVLGMALAAPILLALAIAAVLRFPELGLPAAVFLLWANIPVAVFAEQGLGPIASASVPALLMATVLGRYVAGETFRVPRSFGWMIGVFVVLCVTTMSAAEGAFEVKPIIDFILEGIVVYLLVLNAASTSASLRGALWAMIAAAVLVSLVSVVQAIGGFTEKTFFGLAALDRDFLQGVADSPRSMGPVGDPNYYAQLLLPPLAAAYVFSIKEASQLARRAAGASALLILLGVVFTYSRGATLAMGAMFVVLAAYGLVGWRRTAVLALAGIALIIAVPSYGERILSIAQIGAAGKQVGESDAADLSTQARATENKAALLVFAEHPVVGVGPGNFPAYYQEYALRVGGVVHKQKRRDAGGTKAGEKPRREAHNVLLNIGADQGVLGLCAFLGLVGSVMFGLSRAARGAARQSSGVDPRVLALVLLAAVAGYLLAGLFLTLAFQRYLWLLIALSASAVVVRRKEELRPSPVALQ